MRKLKATTCFTSWRPLIVLQHASIPNQHLQWWNRAHLNFETKRSHGSKPVPPHPTNPGLSTFAHECLGKCLFLLGLVKKERGLHACQITIASVTREILSCGYHGCQERLFCTGANDGTLPWACVKFTNDFRHVFKKYQEQRRGFPYQYWPSKIAKTMYIFEAWVKPLSKAVDRWAHKSDTNYLQHLVTG